MADTPLINDVSDTSLWVAYYRAKESKRKKPLFIDPFAERLVGERGKQIADYMKSGTKHSEWTVIIRTVIIDRYIQKMVKDGIDTVLNLGAGMDTRPYRMTFPGALKWIEVDYPHIIAHKAKLLQDEKPTCQLTRVDLDLADTRKRIAFFEQIALQSKKILVLTEGVAPYLTEQQMTDLSADLIRFPAFTYWIVEYMNPGIYRYLRSATRIAKLKNAPFQFFPKSWLEFFEKQGWVPKEINYLGEEGAILKRYMPTPWYMVFFKPFAPKEAFEKMKRFSGYLLLERQK